MPKPLRIERLEVNFISRCCVCGNVEICIGWDEDLATGSTQAVVCQDCFLPTRVAEIYLRAWVVSKESEPYADELLRTVATRKDGRPYNARKQ